MHILQITDRYSSLKECCYCLLGNNMFIFLHKKGIPLLVYLHLFTAFINLKKFKWAEYASFTDSLIDS